MSRDVARMISEIKAKANTLNRQAAHYASVAKKKAEDEKAVLQAIELLETISDEVEERLEVGEGDAENTIQRITARSYAAAEKLAEYLKVNQSAKCSTILKEVGMTYVTQERMTLAFPSVFEMREIEGSKAITLLSTEALDLRNTAVRSSDPGDDAGF